MGGGEAGRRGWRETMWVVGLRRGHMGQFMSQRPGWESNTCRTMKNNVCVYVCVCVCVHTDNPAGGGPSAAGDDDPSGRSGTCGTSTP